MTILFVILYLISWLISVGLMFAEMHNSVPQLKKSWYKGDVTFAMMLSLFGPISVITALIISGANKFKHGWVWPFSSNVIIKLKDL